MLFNSKAECFILEINTDQKFENDNVFIFQVVVN